MNIAYAAGFFDGEGHIGCQSTWGIYVDISQKSDEPLLLFKSRWGGSIDSRTVYDKRYRKARHHFRWRLSGQEAVQFLEDIKSALTLKQRQAIIGIQIGRLTQRGVKITKEQKALREVLRESLKEAKK